MSRRSAALLAAVLLAHGGAALALTCQSNTAAGNWNAPGTWTGCGGGIPGAGDDVQVRLGHVVTIPAAFGALANSVTFTASNGAARLDHAAATSTLIVGAGGVTMNASGNNNTKAWNINAGSGTVNGALSMSGGGNPSRIVRIQITTGSLDVNGNLTMTAASAARSVIDMSGGAGNLSIAGSFSLASGNGTLTPGAGSTVTYDSATTPVTVATGSSIAYHHLVIAKGAGNSANAAATGDLTVGGDLTVTSGAFNIAGIAAAVTGATSVSGTLGITSDTGAKSFSGAVAINSPDGVWSNTGNAAVTLGAGLTNNGSFDAGNGAYTLTGSLSNGGTFNAGTGNFSLTGDFINDGPFNASTGTFTFNGGTAQSINGSTSPTIFANLTLANAGGLLLAGGAQSVTVTTLLTLTTGAVTTNANVLLISNGSNIASAGGSDFVIGNLSKTVGAGGCTTCNFEIGGAAGYTPVTNLALTGITTGGTVTATTAAAEHPNVATSGIDSGLSANRYWTLTHSGVVFTDFSATFAWVASDLDALADTSVFEMLRYSPPAPAAGTWTSTTAGTRTATSIQVSGVTGFGDFAAGQPLAAAGGIGRFNAYDTTTGAGAVGGFIMTKVAGSAFSADVIAIRNNRKDIDTNFTGTVRVELLNASDNSGALDTATGCNTSWTVIQTVTPDPVFVGADNGRKTITLTENNSWREVRIRISNFPAATLVGCSTDAFAIRPDGFSVSATDATWDTAGVTRALDNGGGRVHKAGQPFTITVTPSPVSVTNYDGTPTASALDCTPATCATGTLTLGAFSGTGTRASSTATYTEAGAFSLALVDMNFAIIDATDGTPADCSASGRFVCQQTAGVPTPVTVGRFVPDRFEFTGANTPVFLTFGAPMCALTRSFTYIGQPFWYAALPSATLNAVAAGGTVTTNYALTPGSSTPAVTETYADASAPVALITTAIGSPTLSGAGTGVYSADAAGELAYNRSPATPAGPFNAAISLTVTATDSTGSAVSGNGTIVTPAPLVFNGGGTGIAFDSGTQFRYGRLRLGNANGSQLVPLRMLLEAQHYSGAPLNTFITNTEDVCTSIAATSMELGNYTSNLNACETSLTVGSFTGGRATVLLSAPGALNNGSVTLTPRLEAGAVGGADTCIAGVSTPVTGSNRLYLQGNWTTTGFTENPTGLATFGVYRGSEEVIFLRENF